MTAQLQPPAHQSIPEMFLARCQRWPELKSFYRRTSSGCWEGLSLAEAADELEALAIGLAARGVGPGTPVAIFSYNRREWQLLDLAVQMRRGLSVPIYMNSNVDQVRYILRHAECQMVFCDTPERLSIAEALAAYLPDLKDVITLEGYAEIRAVGESQRTSQASEIHDQMARISGDDLATISYTSGTTGEPKGVMLTHNNILWGVEAAGTIIPHGQRGDVTVSYLPLAHIAQRMIDLVALEQGFSIHYAPSLDQLPEVLQETRPHILLAVPRVLEKVYNKIIEQVDNKGGLARAVFDRANRAGDAFYQKRAHRYYPPFLGHSELSGALPFLLRLRHRLYDRLLYRKIRSAFGGRLNFIVAGGAALPEKLGRFFYGCRVPVYEVYGLTETAGVLSAGTDRSMRFGTVNQPIPVTEVSIAEDGEIIARGPGIFSGYHKRPETTAEALDSEGWFHTGDLGLFNEHGDLCITGRKKELIVTAGGKNIAPIPIEEKLTDHAAIDQAVVIGDGRPYLVALLTVTGRPDAAALERHVQAVNTLLPRVETIKKYAVLDHSFSVETGELTPTMKLRRSVIAQMYADKIEALYGTT